MLVHQDLKDCPVLVFANKSDLPDSKNPEELVSIYGLNV